MIKSEWTGWRYAPMLYNDGKGGSEWNKNINYERLIIVTHEGNSYTSRKDVPIGIDITNNEYWCCTGNYNSQVENYRQTVLSVLSSNEEFKNSLSQHEENYYNTLKESFEELKINFLKETVFNVKLYGAKGDGETDDTTNIQNCINEACKKGGIVYFPSGIYRISHLEIGNINETTHNVILLGEKLSQAYFDSFSLNLSKGLSLSTIMPINKENGKNLIEFFNCRCCGIEYISLLENWNKSDNRIMNGIVANRTYKSGNLFVKNCNIHGFYNNVDLYGAPLSKVDFCNIQYARNINLQVKGDSRVSNCEISLAGVVLTGVANENKTKNIFQPNGFYGGTGILVLDSAGNTNIYDNLIDWNCKGIVGDSAGGIFITNNKFHHNSEVSVYVRARGDDLGALSCSIINNKFVGGGFIAGSLDCKCHIKLTDSEFNKKVFGSIIGNSFNLSDWSDTYDQDNLMNNPSDTTGCCNANILIKLDSKFDITINSNDAISSSLSKTFLGITARNENISFINFNGNSYDSPYWKSGNVIITKDDGGIKYLMIDGCPSYNDFSENTISFNTNSSPYTWNYYRFYKGKWIGNNQRNIEYNNSDSRPSLSQSDKGFKYYDTTINKLIIFDGSVWRDSNGIAV